MIWLDSSFAVEWLIGSERARDIPIRGTTLGILQAQYTETLVFFGKRRADVSPVIRELSALELQSATPIELHEAAALYLYARERGSKASLADAILAAVARVRDEPVASFDHDFAALGLKYTSGLWNRG